MRHHAWSIACLLVALSPLAASAQGMTAPSDSIEAREPETVRLIGEVRDFNTELPIQGAAVRIVELEMVRITDRNGFFAFDSLPPGRWTFETSSFGYGPNVEASEIAPRSALLVRLEPRPVELEGLYVSVLRRLERRRSSVPGRVVAWDKEDLEAAVAPDVGSFVQRAGVAEFHPCGGELSPNDLPNCFLWRGRLVRYDVYIDDIRLPRIEGASRFWSFDPRDLWAVEFIPPCRQMRVYTQRFMRQVDDGVVRLAPTICLD